MKKYGYVYGTFVTWVGLLLVSCGGGGGSSGAPSPLTSDPAGVVYAGTIFVVDGNPVVGASVSINGIESDVVTDADGYFLISDEDLAVPVVGPGIAAATNLQIGSREKFRLDLVLVIDRSGSTWKPAFDIDGDLEDDSIPEVEVAAMRCFVNGLDPDTTRVSLISFEDEVFEIVAFTNDFDAIDAGLDQILDDGGPAEEGGEPSKPPVR